MQKCHHIRVESVLGLNLIKIRKGAGSSAPVTLISDLKTIDCYVIEQRIENKRQFNRLCADDYGLVYSIFFKVRS